MTALFTLGRAPLARTGLAAAWITSQRRRLRAVHRLHLRRADAALADRLAGAAHRRGDRAAAPLRHRPGRRRRLPRAEHHLRPRPRRQHQRRDASPAGWRAARTPSPSSRTAGSPTSPRPWRAKGGKAPARLGCVEAFNVMRGCPLDFSIYVTGRDTLDPGCKMRRALRLLHPAAAGAGAVPTDRLRRLLAAEPLPVKPARWKRRAVALPMDIGAKLRARPAAALCR